MTRKEASDKLKNLTANIYREPLTRGDFEGAAKVQKVLSVNPETGLAKCKVKFKQDGLVAERFIRLSN